VGAEARAGVRCGDRHQTVECRVRLRREPGAGGQPAHAVSDDDRSDPRCGLQASHRSGDRLPVRVDRAEDRLEADGDARDVSTSQSTQPRVPEAPIAEEAMDEQNAAPTMRGGGQMVRLAPRTKRLAPEEDARRRQNLANPRAQQLGESRTGVVALGVRRSQPRKFDRQDARIADQHKRDETRANPWRSAERPDRGRSDRQRKQGQGNELLDAGEH